VATESINIQNGFEIEQRVLVITLPKVAIFIFFWFCATHKPFLQLQDLKVGALVYSIQSSGTDSNEVLWLLH